MNGRPSVVVVVDDVVVVVGAHEPSLVGLSTLKRLAPLLVLLQVANWMLYPPPPPMLRNAQPAEPGFGGTTSTAPPLPSIVTVIWNVPPLSLIWALFTGPFSPFPSLYLNPFTASPVQKGFCFFELPPVGRVSV